MLLYIHIPFCDSKCHYCSFNSYADKFHLRESYMYSLHVQLINELERFGAKERSIESVFIGGGTPSCIKPELYEKVFGAFLPYLKEDAEITSEANPNSANLKWLEGMRRIGVNRISFGVQSFDDKKLKTLSRAHDSKQAVEAVLNAQKAGFKNISLDLIYGVLADTKELLGNDLQTAFSLPINHLSAYALSIEEGTPFATKPYMSKEKLKLTKRIFKDIKDFGFEQYEISNFGTYKSTHNMGYWQYKDYMGVGSGAVGKLGNGRYYPQNDIQSYIEDPLIVREERLSNEDIKIEKIFLGLRSCVGVDGSILDTEELKRAQLLKEEGKLILKEGVFYNMDYLLADEIALFIS